MKRRNSPDTEKVTGENTFEDSLTNPKLAGFQESPRTRFTQQTETSAETQLLWH